VVNAFAALAIVVLACFIAGMMTGFLLVMAIPVLGRIRSKWHGM
jgi:hypothetical protein